MHSKHVTYALFKLLHDLKNREKDEVTRGLNVKHTFKLLCDLKKKEKDETTKTTEGAPISRVA